MPNPSIVVGVDPAQLERTHRLANLLYAAWHHPDAAVRRRAIGLLAEVYSDKDMGWSTETQAKSAA